MAQYPDYEEIIRYGENGPIAGMRREVSCSAPAFFGSERHYLLECIDSGWITQGRNVSKCEELLAKLCGTRYAIVCSSGTAALHLGLLALGLKPGDGVIVPVLTYVATANAVRYAGGVPIFADVHRDTWCLDPAHAAAQARKWNDETGGLVVGVIPVHLYGMLTDCRQLRLELGLQGWILEDAAEAIGAADEGRPVGGLGGAVSSAAALSFYGNKILTAGEGGALITDREDVAELATLYRGQGAPKPGCYEHDVVGYNYRMTDLQAAILRGQIETFEEHRRRRRRVMERYRWLLRPHELKLFDTQEREPVARNVDTAPWMFVILLPKRMGITRDQVAWELAARGVQTRPVFTPLPALPPYRESSPPFPGNYFPVAFEIARRGLCLPTHAGLEEGDVDYVVEQLLEVIG